MGEMVDVEIPAGRRHIIERPRLTRLLDATSARVIMLVAPAGYGKTTLARQWLSNRPHVWFQAKPASGDVAALAVALADALAEACSAASATQRLTERLRATPDVSRDVAVLADIQADALRQWPPDAWLAIDDYHLLAASNDAERYIELTLNSTPISVLLTSRTRPRWATPRRLLYGELYEIGRAPLAMSETEAESVFARPQGRGLPQLVALADGWPAVIGLAALTAADQIDEALPDTLYDFLADELYHAASPSLQKALPQFALAPVLSNELLESLFGSAAADLLAEARRLGFLSAATAEADIHPLLRTFLLEKIPDQNSEDLKQAARHIADFLFQHDQWDDLFTLLKRYSLPDVLINLIDRAYGETLRAGRLTTLSEWLEVATQLKLTDPVLDVARAEVALRQGAIVRAEALSLQIANRDVASDRFRSRALAIAGQAAHLDNRDEDALSHYERASSFVQERDEQRNVLWGRLVALQAFDSQDQLRQTLDDFLRYKPETADEAIQAVNARLMVAATVGGILPALEEASATKNVLADAIDPLVRTGFEHSLSRTLSLAARYPEAVEIAGLEIAEAQRTRLTFVLPHAYVDRAIAQLGLRHYRQAEMALTQAHRLASEIGDFHNIVEVQTVRCKLAIATADFDRAVGFPSEPRAEVRLTAHMRAEHKATRALALACAGELAQARKAAAEAVKLTSIREVISLASCARAVIAVQSRAPAEVEAALTAELRPLFDDAILDPLVIACRGCPSLLENALASDPLREPLSKLFTHADDQRAVSSDARLPPLSQLQSLTPREAEVLDLLALGYTNREIANALHIAEVTAKVHVRRVLQKLGVRSRTEAALLALKDR
jgi:LuxR family transcriptional regulator, maltose regulon positive regulatory protein